ncbi:hypothetical protein BGX26_007037 [Mortierella sp. AD094]|nr:hypothetical protein BGX26_007037 [Mortierella sp. AD094]
MRFHTIIASAIAVIAAVSAQTTTSPDVPSTACTTCIGNNVLAVSACKGLSYGSLDPNSTDPAAKACFCALAGDLSWVTGCNGANACPASLVSSIQSAYSSAQGSLCAGVVTTKSAAGTLTAPKAGAVLLVAAAAALL